MTTAAQATLGPGDRYRVLRELGRRTRKTFAAIREPHELVVLQRFVRRDGSASGIAEVAREGEAAPAALPEETASFVTAEQIALLLRDARSLEKHWHPNVARVKHVAFAAGDLRVATELIDGVTLADLLASGASRSEADRTRLLSLPVLLRVLVDVLGGLHGLHGLRDATMAPLEAMHGELSPANVVVGRDGVARLVAVLRPRPVRLAVGSEATGYASPEMMDAAAIPDARADVYAVGVMLWEAIRGTRLYGSGDLGSVAQLQRSEELETPALPESSPFVGLEEVAMRALAFDPALRFRTASEMASEIRRIAGTRLAPGSVVAQAVAELGGERIRARRAELDPVASGTRKRATTGASLPPNAAALDAVWGESEEAPAPEAVTGRISEAPLPSVEPVDADDGDQEITTVADKEAGDSQPATPVGTTTAPRDPPRASPKSDARYLVVPPRPMLESVDSDALENEETRRHAAATEPSTSRIKVAAPTPAVPRPLGRPATPASPLVAKAAPVAAAKAAAVAKAPEAAPVAVAKPAPVAEAAKDAAVASPAPPAAVSARPPKLYEPDPEPNAETSIEITSVEVLASAPTDDEVTAVAKTAAPPLVAATPSVPPRLPERAKTARAPEPAPVALVAPVAPVAPLATEVGAEDPAARAEIPRLWTESSPEFPSTNVMEGDFVRALKAAASEPPGPAALSVATATEPFEPVQLPTPTAADPATTAAGPTPTAAGPFFPVTPRVLSMSSVSPEELAARGGSAAEPTNVDPLPPAEAAAAQGTGAPLGAIMTPEPMAFGSLPVPAGLDPQAPPELADQEARRARARRVVLGVVGACGLLLVAALGATALSGGDAPAKTARPPAATTAEPTAAATTTAAPTPTPVATTTAAEAPAAEPTPTATAAPSPPPAERPLPTVAAKPAAPVAAPVTRPAVAAPVPAPRPAAAPASRPGSGKPKKPSFDPSGI